MTECIVKVKVNNPVVTNNDLRLRTNTGPILDVILYIRQSFITDCSLLTLVDTCFSYQVLRVFIP
jgi:hypothetical protein